MCRKIGDDGDAASVVIDERIERRHPMKGTGIALLVLASAWLVVPARFAGAAETDAEAEANRVAHDRVLCRKYGYEEPSVDFARCLEVLANRRTEATIKTSTERRKSSSQQRAVTSAESSACDTRRQVVDGGSRVPANAHEGGTGTCGH
jgi:hypothetical protein